MSWLGRVLGREQKTEKRDVQFSPQLSAYLANRGVGQLSGTGVAVNPDTALRFMAVYACIRVIAEDVASLPLHLYRRLNPRGKERATNHPLYDVLHRKANEEQSSFAWRETMQTHVLLGGNAFSLPTMFNGRVVELWPIMPSRVSIRRNRETKRLEYIITPPGGTNERPVLSPLGTTGNGAREIFHLPGQSLDGVTGLSPISIGREAIGLGLASQEFASGFFQHGARPSAVLEYPGQLSEEAHNRLKASFEEAYSGLANSQKVALIEEGMKLNTSYTMPLEDAQFIENRKMSIEEIARLFRVQPHKIGHHEHSTFSNIEHLGIDHVVSTIRPWLVRWEQAIGTKIIPKEEQERFFVEFLVDGLLRGDSEGRSKLYQALWNMGAMSPNDIREKEGMNPVDGGDTYYVPLNFVDANAPKPEPVAPEPAQTPSNGRKPVGAAA